MYHTLYQIVNWYINFWYKESKLMGKLSDIQIKAWITAGERFEGRSDGNGLYLCNRESFAVPKWKFRYSISGKARAMWIGSYGDLSLAKARETVRQLSARVALGYDVAGEKKERKATAIATIEAERMPVKYLT
jgi:hypothetical protein